MIFRYKEIVLLIITLLLSYNDTILGQTVVYPAPAGITPSTRYSVVVNNQNSFVFQSTFVSGSGESRGDFTSFSTSVTVPVIVSTNDDISTVTIRPLALGISYKLLDTHTISMDVPSNCNLSVEINGNTETPLFIFSNPLEIDVPSTSDSNVIYYAPGQIYTENITPKAGQIIYIAGGAVLKGNITSNGVSNFIVRGRGILDSSINTTSSRTVRVIGGSNITFEGIVLHSVQGWSAAFGTCDGLTLNNIKIISTPNIESDALDIVGCQNVKIEGGFFRSEDDCICIKSTKAGYSLGVGNPKNIQINGAVIFNGHHGNALEIGYELNGITDSTGQSYVRDISYTNIDIIHKGTATDGSTYRRAAISIHNNENARVSNVNYNDIRIEDCKENYVYLSVIKTSGAVDTVTRGVVDSVYLKNIQISGGDLTLPSVINGFDSTHRVENVTFDTFRVGCNLITSTDQLNLYTNSYVGKITFRNTTTDSNQIGIVNSKIYPTFCRNELFVIGFDSAGYAIIDLAGKTMWSGVVKSKSISVENLPAGTYLIKFNLNFKSAIHKFVKL